MNSTGEMMLFLCCCLKDPTRLCITGMNPKEGGNDNKKMLLIQHKETRGVKSFFLNLNNCFVSLRGSQASRLEGKRL